MRIRRFVLSSLSSYHSSAMSFASFEEPESMPFSKPPTEGGSSTVLFSTNSLPSLMTSEREVTNTELSSFKIQIGKIASLTSSFLSALKTRSDRSTNVS